MTKSIPEGWQDMLYGDRRGMVKDPCGNIWQIATHKEDVSLDDLRLRAAATPAP